MEKYFDNAATTKVCDEAINVINKILKEDYGNPSSLHRKGMDAEKYIKIAKEDISKLIGCDESEIYFTSCGTESNNIAILGTCDAYKRDGNKIITSKIEHPSVLQVFKKLESDFNVVYLNVDENGYVDLNQLEQEVDENTILVSIMHVNNEIGTVQDIKKITEIIKGKNKNTLFHTDAVQSFGKYDVNVKNQNIDLLSISGHKIYGPKGVGILYIKNGLKTKPIMFGGGHQKGMRPGTENVAYSAAIAEASKVALSSDYKDLKTYFIDKLKENIKDDYLILGDENASYHILAVAFKGIRAEVMLHSLESDNIFVSSGSACSSKKKTISHVLDAINLNKDYTEGVIRFSFSKDNTKEEIDYVIERLKFHLDFLKKYAR